MCPVCWAALIAQAVFFTTLGLVLVVVTDLKLGLPLSLVTMALSAGNWWCGWMLPNWLLYVCGALLLGRAVVVLVKHENNWVRKLALKFGKWVKRKVRPLVYGS